MQRAAMFLVSLLLAAGFGLAQEQNQQLVVDATNSQYGFHLVDGEGRTLYLFETAEPSDEMFTQGVRESAAECTGECLEAWPPADAPGGVTAGENLDPELLYVENINGIDQAVYNGWPLYYFVQDQQPGQISGQGIESFGGEWYVINADGTPAEQEQLAAGGGEEQEAAGGGEALAVEVRPLEDLRVLLMEGGLAGGPTPQTVEAFQGWQQTLDQGAPNLAEEEQAEADALSAAVDDVLLALDTEPFDTDAAAQSLQRLALTMRVVASGEVPDEESLLVEVASLVSQTAAVFESEEFEFDPRFDVNVP